MQAIILAAGMGKRLKDLTKDCTKCMVKVNGISLIKRMLCQLDGLHLSRIVLVIGYKGKKLVDYISSLDVQTPICYINNPVYEKTNNIYSLSLAKEYLVEDDTLLLESDLIFEDNVLKVLLDDPRGTLALVDKYQSWMDGTCIMLGEDDRIERFIRKKEFKFDEIKTYYKTVNIYKFSRHFSETHYVPFLDAYRKTLGENEYYEQVLRVVAMLDDPEIRAKCLDGQLWYEIDDIQDLDIATSMFMSDGYEKVSMVSKRYGGYWRYPRLIDFCYLVNPYFPPGKLMDEIRANFGTLMTQYPSGMDVQTLLAAKNFGIQQENIIVGNGAAEIIKILMEALSGTIGFIRPTFEEYPNRYDRDSSIFFIPDNADHTYTADDLITFFGDKSIQNLVIVNPDNPSGNYIKKQDILRLVKWTKERRIQLILDESFVDFTDEPDATMIVQNILDANKHLYIMKSISKSYGVPGLRLGILASGDLGLIAVIKKKIAIWNINSFAEYYMQIAEKYQNEYQEALSRFRIERTRFQKRLNEISNLRIIPSQANYIMAELIGSMTASELAMNMMVKYNILIKDLTEKMNGKPYIRIAIRNTEDNNRLIEALEIEL